MFKVTKVNVCGRDHGIIELSNGRQLVPNLGCWDIDDFGIVLKEGDEISFLNIEQDIKIPDYNNKIIVNGVKYNFSVGPCADSYNWLIYKK